MLTPEPPAFAKDWHRGFSGAYYPSHDEHYWDCGCSLSYTSKREWVLTLWGTNDQLTIHYRGTDEHLQTVYITWLLTGETNVNPD